jgi:hypothetical protein
MQPQVANDLPDHDEESARYPLARGVLSEYDLEIPKRPADQITA